MATCVAAIIRARVKPMPILLATSHPMMLRQQCRKFFVPSLNHSTATVATTATMRCQSISSVADRFRPQKCETTSTKIHSVLNSRSCLDSSCFMNVNSLRRHRTSATVTKTTGVDSSSSATRSHSSSRASEAAKVTEETEKIHAHILEINNKIHGPLLPLSNKQVALPMVLCVGNHSSGKSSFINYVLNQKIQTAGVAPTDDAFSILAPSNTVHQDQDGPAVIGDPDLGFQDLQQFGPTLTQHVQLKLRTGIQSDFIMVDSPGMIDSPGNYAGMMLDPNSASSEGYNPNTLDRGYDFTGVVRWFATRADIVCLFFDPQNPGTTGETLSVLLHALSGMDHKLLIILNKADQFEKIHDFARAYGSLCWNLSKVIPRKDLPKIYTMCLPLSAIGDNNKLSSGASTDTDARLLPEALRDLHSARDEVVAEVRRAPARRLDNVITNLADAAQQLKMHAIILQDIQSRWSRLYWRCRSLEIGIVSVGSSLATGLAMYGLVSNEIVAGIVAATMSCTGGVVWYHSIAMKEWETNAKSPPELAAAFQRTHAVEVASADESVVAIWQRIRSPLAAMFDRYTLSELETVKDDDITELVTTLQSHVPTLRRQVSPPHIGKS